MDQLFQRQYHWMIPPQYENYGDIPAYYEERINYKILHKRKCMALRPANADYYSKSTASGWLAMDASK